MLPNRCIVCFLTFIVSYSISIHVPGENVDKKTLTTLGIKTLDWQDNENVNRTQISVHHNYSKVLVQHGQVTSQYSHQNNFGQQAIQDLGGQMTLEDDDDFTSQSFQLANQQNSFAGQENNDELLQSSSNVYQQSYNKRKPYQETNNEQIYNFYGNRETMHLDEIIEAESQKEQQIQDLSAFDNFEENQERIAKNYYTLDKPIYVHGFKYPPDPKDVYPSNKDLPNTPPRPYKNCPKMATGSFVYALSCNQYLNCWKGRGYVQNCAPGTLFNPQTLECDFASKVKCITGGSSTNFDAENQYYTINKKPEMNCPAGFSGVIPHHSDCSKFINCANGAEYITDCPPGTLFSLKINNCDFPYKAECAGWSTQFGTTGAAYGSNTGNSQVNEGTAASHGHGANEGGSHHQGTTSTGFHQSSQTSHNFAQQPGNQNHGSQTQHVHGVQQQTYDQNQYYGGGQTQSHLHEQQQYASNSGQNQDHYIHGTTQEHQYGQNQNQNWFGSQNGHTGQGHYLNQGQYSSHGNQESQGVDYSCPKGFTGLLPHPLACTKFLNCANGQFTIEACNPGTHFNPFTKICDFPSNVKCGQKQDEDLTGSQTQYIHGNQQSNYDQSYQHGASHASSSGYGVNQIDDAGKWGRAPKKSKNVVARCPEGGSGLYPHPTICSKFLNCANGITYIQDCGPGTVFNPQLKVCDFPYNVDCEDEGEFHGEGLIDVKSVPRPPQPAGHFYQAGYGQNHQTSQQGSYGQSQTGSYGQSQAGSYDQSQAGSYDQSQQGSYGQNQQGSYGQNQQGKHDQSQLGSYGHSQQGFYGQNSNTDQDTQETKHYGSSNGQNTVDYQFKPSTFPSTDTNADYEFESEGDAPEPVLQPHQPSPKPSPSKPHSKDSRKHKGFCEASDFYCSVNDCISQNMVCDGFKDCPNGIDEQQQCEKYLEKFTHTPDGILGVRDKERHLNVTSWHCAKVCLTTQKFQCKSFSYRKADGACFLSDSNIGQSGALIYSKLYSYHEVTAYSTDCKDHYKCPNEKCIRFKQVCDGVNDCGDRTDERGCDPKAFGYEISLSGTDKKHEGRIELKAFGKRGYICDDKFGLRDADVACRELGFPLGAVEVKGNSYYAQELNDKDVFYLMDDVTCLGNETSLKECDFNGWGVHNCETQEVVGVVCKTPMENCPKDQWKCDTVQECIPLTFVCDDVMDCTDQSDEASQHCEAPTEIRLVNGESRSEGRVEIRHHGIWGTVCDDDFNDDAAKVVCKYLGYPGTAKAIKDGYFGAGTGPIWLDQVYCQGNESSLQQCVHWNWGEHNCEHSEDVGVACSNSYNDLGDERNVKLNQRQNVIDVLPEVVLPDRCGLRKDDQFVDDDNVHFRVVHGSLAKGGDYPWQASLKIKNKSKPSHWCGAVVISRKFILTAAHCLVGFSKGAYFVVAGDYNTDDVEGTEQEAYIEEFYVHDKFRVGQKMNNDIALVKLKGDGFMFTKDVQPICLPPASLEYEVGLNCTISGFGTVQSGQSGYSHIMRAGWIPLLSKEVCQMPHVYGTAITDGMMCAGSLDEGVDACEGDSGGPLACLNEGFFTLYGITSWGQHCGHANKPGVYVKVSHYRDWIEETINKHL